MARTQLFEAPCPGCGYDSREYEIEPGQFSYEPAEQVVARPCPGTYDSACDYSPTMDELLDVEEMWLEDRRHFFQVLWEETGYRLRGPYVDRPIGYD